ncbi:MAG: hypothetical protein LBD11_04565 [Candidatus Peribacteria bacterium]|nr:hypothetical protein [Candidatus Peribacteria bacterium]
MGDFLKKGEYYEDLGMVKFFRYTDQNTGETSIVAGWIVSNSANDAEVTLSTAYAKECIMDLFKQRYPIFNQLIRQYQTRYMDEWDTHAGITGRTRLDW